MKMKYFKIIFIILFISAEKVSGQNTVSLKQCVDIAVQNNFQIQEAKSREQTLNIEKNQAKTNLLPSVSGNVDQGFNQGRSIDPFTNSYINQQVSYTTYNLSAEIILFNGLNLQNSIAQNRLAYEAGKYDLQQTKETVILNVILSYLQVLKQEDLLLQSVNDAEVSRNQVERLAILDSVGAVSPSQYHDLKGQWSSNRLAVTDNRNALISAKLMLSQLMNVSYDENIQLERITAAELAAADTSGAASIQSAASQLAIVKSADLKIQSARKDVMASRGKYFPRLILYGNLNTNYSSVASRDVALGSFNAESGDYVTINGNTVPVFTTFTNYSTEKINYRDQFENNYNTSFGLSLQIPIVNSFQNRHAVALSKIRLKSAENNAASVKTQLMQAVEQAYQNMKSAFDRYNALIEQVRDFSESFREVELKFNKGAVNSVEYLVAKNNLEKSKSNLIIARYDFILKGKILDYYKGTLSF
jgi:outer membrane protein